MKSLNGEDKVALLLSGLDSQAADGVLQQFSAERKNRILELMQHRSGSSASSTLVDQMLQDLAAIVARQNAGRPSLRVHAPDETSHHKISPFTEHAPDKGHPPADVNDSVAQLRAINLDRLLAGLEGEHPQTVATVIGCLDSRAASELLKKLPAETRRLAFLRVAQSSSSPADLVAHIVQAIVQKCQAVADAPAAEKQDAKYQKMAALLKRLERTDRVELLAALTEQDGETAALVKNQLYVFEDLCAIEDRSVQRLLAEVDSKTLATALKDVAEDILEKVLSNLSKRGREMVTEEISYLGQVSTAQIQQAQKAIVDVIQRMDQAGELVMLPEA
jgi:flagellar motor switch protein FliG